MLFTCSSSNTNHQANTIVQLLTMAVAQHNARLWSLRCYTVNEMRDFLRTSIAPYYGEAVQITALDSTPIIIVTYPAVTGHTDPILIITYHPNQTNEN